MSNSRISTMFLWLAVFLVISFFTCEAWAGHKVKFTNDEDQKLYVTLFFRGVAGVPAVWVRDQVIPAKSSKVWDLGKWCPTSFKILNPSNLKSNEYNCKFKVPVDARAVFTTCCRDLSIRITLGGEKDPMPWAYPQ